MEFEELLENLKNAEIEPSAGCWERLEYNLAGGAGEMTPDVPAKETAAKVAGASAGKAAAVITGAVAVAAAVTFSILQITDNQQNNNIPTTTVEVTEEKNENTADTLFIEQQTEEKTIEVKTDALEKTFTKSVENTENKQFTEIDADVPSEIDTKQDKEEYIAVNQQLTSVEEQMPTEQATAGAAAQPTQQSQEQYVYNNEEVATTEDNEFSTDDTELFLEIPNVITPNGDGINDVFVINGLEKCEKFHLIIKNQSGRQVLSTQVYHNDWGGGAQAGTYFYSISYEYNGKPQMRNGVITVVK